MKKNNEFSKNGTENFTNVLTKDASNMIKGVSVLMMLAHHLWGFPDRMQDLPLSGIFVQIGEAFKMCVSIFMFLSGYGLYVTWKKSGRCLNVAKRVWNTYKRFWHVFFIFVPVGLLFFGVSFHWGEFLDNMFCLSYSYNHEWWFLGTYIELLIVLSLVLRFEKYIGFTLLLIVSAIIFRALSEIIFIKSGGVFLHLFNFGYYYPAFMLGLLSAKYTIFEHFVRMFDIRKRVLMCVMFIAISFFVRKLLDVTVMTTIMIPAVVYLFAVILNSIGKANTVFRIAGKHSMNMWLIHTYFIYYYLRDMFLSITHNAMFAYIVLVVLSYLSSVVLDCFWAGLSFGMNKLKNKE